MLPASQDSITHLLARLQQGERVVFDELFGRVYTELLTIAHQRRQRWHGDYTLNTTALVHEAYLKLVDQTASDWKNRAHFFAVASKAIHHILIDYARQRDAQKRGGDWERVSLDDASPLLGVNRLDTLLSLNEVLERLQKTKPQLVEIVQCRFFGGMTIEETAEALEISTATVKRSWVTARTWLYRELGGNGSG